MDFHGAPYHSTPDWVPPACLRADFQAAIVESVSSVWWHWLIAKLLAGVGIGAVQATLPVVSQFQRNMCMNYPLTWPVHQRARPCPGSRSPHRRLQSVSQIITATHNRGLISARWFALGNLMSNVTLKAMAETRPNDWKTPIYTQFGMIGASIIIFVFLPESPCALPSGCARICH